MPRTDDRSGPGPVLLINPSAGDEERDEAALREEADRLGIRVVELGPDDEIETKAAAALETGASAIGIAGGDGSQGIVAGLAARKSVPYACIPAGTRNHFALDLGLDRDDPCGAMAALKSGEERRVDLGEINGRTFVNNVSLGVYAEAVAREEYRDSKFRTVLETATAIFGNEDNAPQLRWVDAEGEERCSILLLVSNNPYRLGSVFGRGSRPRLDEGLLGIVDVRDPGHGAGPPWHQQNASEFVVDADNPISVAIDGDPAELQPPLRFRSLPGALRVLTPNAR